MKTEKEREKIGWIHVIKSNMRIEFLFVHFINIHK